MTGFRIRNLSGIQNLQCFVSKYSGGNDEWFPVPHDFSDPKKCHWSRNGWEVVVFKNPANGKRRGWYLNCHDKTYNISFVGFDLEIGLFQPDH